MLYMGGKGRLGKSIAGVILSDTPLRKQYLEPFLGGGNSFEHLAPHFSETAAGDLHEDLMQMWTAASQGWVPPDSVTEEEYLAAREQGPSPTRGFIGFGASFGGKWWGGYARNARTRGADHKPRNYAGESSRSIIRIARTMRNTRLLCAAYDSWTVSEGVVVYADPPYSGTTGYKVQFDGVKFWATMHAWSDLGARVYVSEYAAPPGWEAIWSRDTREAQFTNRAGVRSEKLFVLRRQ